MDEQDGYFTPHFFELPNQLQSQYILEGVTAKEGNVQAVFKPKKVQRVEAMFLWEGRIVGRDESAPASKTPVPHPHRGETVDAMTGTYVVPEDATVMVEMVTVVDIMSREKFRVPTHKLWPWSGPFTVAKETDE